MEAFRAGTLWPLYESLALLRGEFLWSQKDLLWGILQGVRWTGGSEEGTSSQGCLRNAEFSMQCGLEQCGLQRSPVRCLICRGRGMSTDNSDLLHTLVKINEYILAVLSPSFDCSPSQRQPWYRAESRKIYEKAGEMQPVAFLGMGVILGMMMTPVHFQHSRWKVPDVGNLGACDQNMSQWNNWAKLARAVE